MFNSELWLQELTVTVLTDLTVIDTASLTVSGNFVII